MVRTVYAPAKINLYLEVCGRRPDGYHELGMIMQKVSLCDRLEISLVATPGVRTVCPGLELAANEENIAARAARALLGRLARPPGVEIRIDKRIPAAAGLGGGSSDAAAVLLALDEMLDLRLAPDVLRQVGVGLGADVPFFLFQHSAWATGIGDRLAPFALPPAWYVLVNPGFAVSTAWVYGNLGLTTLGRPAKMPGFPRTGVELAQLLHNDLERITIARYPQLAKIKSGLLEAGALGALMSGSGPTVFGLFSEEAAAQRAADRFTSDQPAWRVFVVRPWQQG